MNFGGEMNFDARAHLSELMDEPCSYEDFRACLQDLAQVNTLTLSYRPTIQWLSQRVQLGQPPLHIVDVGCGGGDMLRHIADWGKREKRAVRLTGIDLNPYAARVARELTCPKMGIEWVTGDAFSYQPDAPIDLVISSLFTHHLPDAEIVRFLAWMERVTVRGWFINDLHREAVPYYGFMVLSRVLRWHRFVQHDGPVSFRRAFRQADWAQYLRDADVPLEDVDIRTFRPARLCVSRVKG